MAVRELAYEFLDGSVAYRKFAGKSTDTKPTGGIATGSQFFEINTGKTYYYDEDGAEGSEWVDPTATST